MPEHNPVGPEDADFMAGELTVEDITADKPGENEHPESAGIPGKDKDADDELSRVREERRAQGIAVQKARVKELRAKAGLSEEHGDREAA